MREGRRSEVRGEGEGEERRRRRRAKIEVRSEKKSTIPVTSTTAK